MKYRKKPVVIDAVKFNGRNAFEVLRFMGEEEYVDYRNPFERDAYDNYIDKLNKQGVEIKTLEGTMLASVGDYVIKGIQGEFYPCKPDVFEQTYEAVE